jgi:predicted nucleic acid-binding protein
MNRPIVLDSGPLGRIVHPRPNPEIIKWLNQQLSANISVIIPEIADYEVRRSLLLADLTKSIVRLDQLKQVLNFLPISSAIMLKAAELWAEARKRGRPTADPKELDGDVILAAQALDAGAIVATENIGHLSLFVEARNWKEMLLTA